MEAPKASQIPSPKKEAMALDVLSSRSRSLGLNFLSFSMAVKISVNLILS